MFKFKILAVLLLLTCTGFLFSCSPTSSQTQNDTGTLSNMKITIPKIGRADCVIIETGTHTVLIDTGEEDDAQEILDYLNSNNIKTIDYLIITHYDKDHVGGADKIIDAVKVSKVFQPNYKKDSEEYNQYVSAMSNAKITPLTLGFNQSFTLDGAVFTMMPAVKSSYKLDKDNECSIVVSLVHGENSFLFAADALTERMQELVTANIGQHDFLKFPNHGDYNEGVEQFLAVVNPQYNVITCSEKNPSNERVLSIIDEMKIKNYETVNGDIVVKSDAKIIEIIQ